MTDEKVADLLRSEAQIVVIEAPAGCGKTHQAASYAADVAESLDSAKLLVLTHTHAACSVIAERTRAHHGTVDIRTLDSLINMIATAYRLSINLPDDISAWARTHGYEQLATKVANLLRSNPMIAKHLARLFPIIICDEHQDSNEAQDEIVRTLSMQGAHLRIFGDPMQIIPGGRGQDDEAAASLARWNAMKDQSAFGELVTPHRWRDTNPELGEWILNIREKLKCGEPIDLNSRLPRGVNVKFAENGSLTPGSYRLAPENQRDLNVVLNENKQMLLVASTNPTIQSLRGTFRPRFPIWEGHTRKHLEKFIATLDENTSNMDAKVSAFVVCLKCLLVGFTRSKYTERLCREIGEPSNNPRGKIPPELKVMAELIRECPNHVGFARAAAHLKELIIQNVGGFTDLKIDYRREFDDLIKLSGYEDPLKGFAEISQRRSRTYPKPPRKALSTIHKSKGLEAEFVVVFACDDSHFPDKNVKRNLLYVALSRATESVSIVVSRNNQSPLVEI